MAALLSLSKSKSKIGFLIALPVTYYLSINNSGFTHGPILCIFRSFTGHPCPACGSIRSIGALAQGDLLAAWQFNPLTFLAVITYVSYVFFPKSITMFIKKIDQVFEVRRRYELNPILVLSIGFILLWIFNLQRWS